MYLLIFHLSISSFQFYLYRRSLSSQEILDSIRFNSHSNHLLVIHYPFLKDVDDYNIVRDRSGMDLHASAMESIAIGSDKVAQRCRSKKAAIGESTSKQGANYFPSAAERLSHLFLLHSLSLSCSALFLQSAVLFLLSLTASS